MPARMRAGFGSLALRTGSGTLPSAHLMERISCMTALQDTLLPALPEDVARAVLAGRVWRPELSGPAVVAVRECD